MSLSEIIQKILVKSNMSQDFLAQELGVSFATVNRWKNGKTFPQKATLDKLNKIYKRIENTNMPAFPDRTRRPTAICFFAGGGGMHLGLEHAGFNVILASDIERSSEETHKKNWPKIPFILGDIRELSADKLLKLTGGRSPDLIAGGPPCQGFSTLGDKLSSDPRNDLFEAYARLVDKLEPKCVLIENVKALSTMYKGRYLENIIKRFSGLGYAMFKTVLNAADYGVPQVRLRTFIFGTKLANPYSFPKNTHNPSGVNPFTKVGDNIMDLVNKNETEVQNHSALNHSEIVVKRYKLIPEGGRLPPPEELPEELRRKNFGNTYKRLNRETPSLTMVPGNNAFPIHPTLHRSLTPREAARLQTFPDGHIFVGNRKLQCILVGNAVPPLLAKVLGENIIKHMRNEIDSEDGITQEEVIVCNYDNTSELESILGVSDLQKKSNSEGFIDLFCGAGGFTIGLTRAGYKPILCADNNRDVALTHEKNYPNIPFLEGDLGDEKIQKVVERYVGNKEVAIVAGGPPCQGFSVFGKRRFVNTKGYKPHTDPRNNLVYAYLDVIRTVKPRWFIMENVPGIANLDGGLFLQSLISEFKSLGYVNTEAKILNAANYGVPQKRKRLIIIGNITGHIIPWPKKKFFQKPKDWQDAYRTVGEVISDLAEDSSQQAITCHVPMKHKPLLVERYGYIPEGGKLNVEALPTHLKKGYRTEKVKNYSHIFKRLHRKEAAITMVPGHNAFPIHPWLNRALTVREAARIQTFPDQIEFKGSRQNQCIQVGNGFPPLLAEVIANNIIKAEKNGWFPSKTSSSAYYSLVDDNQDDLFDHKDSKTSGVVA